VPAQIAPPAPSPRRPARDLERAELLAALDPAADPIYLASVVIALVKKGRREDVDRLFPLLEHSDDRVRANAVEVLGAHGNELHIPLLLPLLEDRSNRVAGNACLALARFDHPAVPRRIAAMLKSTLVSMRETATYVLSVLDKDYVEPLLIRAASDPYEGVRLRAIRALPRFLTRESVTALKNALNDIDINICETAAAGLRAIKAVLQARRAEPEAPATDAAGPPPAVDSALPPAAPGGEVRPGAADARDPSLAGAIGPGFAGPAGPATPLAVDDAVPPGSLPADQPPGPRPDMGLLASIHHELGTAVYQLCRSNALTNEILDGIFYEILRYQDFLRAYQAKQARGDDPSQRQAIEKLEEKIRVSLVSLGRQAAPLINDRQVSVPERDQVAIHGILDRLRKARRSTTRP
jgi:hypothetical protein